MKILKQSTATTILLGPFLDDTNGKDAETALTISQADVQLWKEGGTTMAQKSEATSATHRANGCYTCPIDATDTGTLGQLSVSVHEAGALPVRHDFFVVPADVYDALKAGTGGGIYAATQSLAAGSVTAAAVATGAIDADALAADAGTEIAAALKALVVENSKGLGINFGDFCKYVLAAVGGYTSNNGLTFKAPHASGDTRITATVNGSNERTSITLSNTETP